MYLGDHILSELYAMLNSNRISKLPDLSIWQFSFCFYVSLLFGFTSSFVVHPNGILSLPFVFRSVLGQVECSCFYYTMLEDLDCYHIPTCWNCGATTVCRIVNKSLWTFECSFILWQPVVCCILLPVIEPN